MGINLVKLILLGTVSLISLDVASNAMNSIVLEVESRQPTITDVIIKQQVQETLKEAEKEIDRVAQEENIVIATEEVQIKPAEPPKEKPEPPIEPADTTTDAAIEVPSDTLEEGTLVAEGETTDQSASFATLSEEEMTYVTQYLIDHYFLFGEIYYTQEEDPVLYERKKLAADMESAIIATISNMQGLASSLFSLQSSMIMPVLEETATTAQQFVADFAHVANMESPFNEIYTASLEYFEAYLTGMHNAYTTFTTIETTTNKALILPMMLKSINQDILPAIKDVLNQGFAVKEETNKVYLEGVDDAFLLTPQDVLAILENPSTILPPTT